MKLAERLKQESFVSPAQESMLSLMVTHSWLMSVIASVMHKHELTPAQYNVLRILRGSHPEALTCSDVGDRLLDRTPDVTRLLDRLEKAGFLKRQRAKHDRRVVEVTITKKGIDKLATMQSDVEDAQRHVTENLSETEHRALCDLLERLRDGEE